MLYVHDVALRDRRGDRAASSNGLQPTPAYTSPSLLGDLSTAQISHILQIFRTKYYDNFPFVNIEEQVSAADLQRQRPTVFRCIMLAAAPLPANKVEAMKEEFLGYFGSKILVENTRNLDILQGMLICIAW